MKRFSSFIIFFAFVAFAFAAVVQPGTPVLTINKLEAPKDKNEIKYDITVEWKGQKKTRVDVHIVPINGGSGHRFFVDKFNLKPKKDETTIKMEVPLQAGDYLSVFTATYNNDKTISKNDLKSQTKTVTGGGRES